MVSLPASLEFVRREEKFSLRKSLCDNLSKIFSPSIFQTILHLNDINALTLLSYFSRSEIILLMRTVKKFPEFSGPLHFVRYKQMKGMIMYLSYFQGLVEMVTLYLHIL